ncbi:MAG: hypothetical protein A6F72_08510 [Cycloclasticus sp. symbiont of Poecilosclerida sp. N]|nr:MAG: hypothetical protein A6F72_08510 [Cycloclasticus sp. symbiont of Poecilosclerida sp. N]
MSFLLVYNYQKKLKSLKYQSPYDKMLELFAEDANNFKQNPNHTIAGLNIYPNDLKVLTSVLLIVIGVKVLEKLNFSLKKLK